MTNKMPKWACLLVGMLFSTVLLADSWTQYRDPGSIQFSGNATEIYIKAKSGSWAPSECPNITYAWISNSLPGRKEMLALLLTAQANGSKVRFFGTCSGNYLRASFMTVQ